jgi:hypothetical protein
MTFDEWWKKNGPFPEHISRGFCELAWNAALDEAEQLADVYGDSIHLPDRIRDLKTPS